MIDASAKADCRLPRLPILASGLQIKVCETDPGMKETSSARRFIGDWQPFSEMLSLDLDRLLQQHSTKGQGKSINADPASSVSSLHLNCRVLSTSTSSKFSLHSIATDGILGSCG